MCACQNGGRRINYVGTSPTPRAAFPIDGAECGADVGSGVDKAIAIASVEEKLNMNLLERSLSDLNWKIEEFPNLAHAFSLSEERVHRAREELKASISDSPKIDVIAFGSLARYEMTGESDLDYLVVVHGLDKTPGSSRRAIAAADDLRKKLGDGDKEIRRPGKTGVFGIMISAVDLVEVIGLESDTNHSHTRRILFLEESVSLYKPEKQERLLESILRRYTDAKPIGKTQVPRFLLNDLARYWRTLTVDYQAKTTDNNLSLRYLKLVVSRKFTYVASILPLLLFNFDEQVGKADPDGSRLISKLKDTFSKPPIIRFLESCKIILSVQGDDDLECHLYMVLKSMESFNGLLGSGAWRSAVEAEALSGNDAPRPEFDKGMHCGRDLQQSLEAIFFSELLLPLTKKYLVL